MAEQSSQSKEKNVTVCSEVQLTIDETLSSSPA